MIYIKCTTGQMNTLCKRAKVTVAIDQRAIDYIKQNLNQKLCLLEVVGNGWHGRKMDLINHEIKWNKAGYGLNSVENSKFIAYRQLTWQEEELIKIKATEKEKKKKRKEEREARKRLREEKRLKKKSKAVKKTKDRIVKKTKTPVKIKSKRTKKQCKD